MTTTKPARTLRVTTPAGATYAVVTEGRKVDTYRLDAGFACVRWVHTGDESRGGIVSVNGAGRATGCDCPAGRRGKACRHQSGTEVMIAGGMLDMPVVAETREAMAEVPEGWLCSIE